MPLVVTNEILASSG